MAKANPRGPPTLEPTDGIQAHNLDPLSFGHFRVPYFSNKAHNHQLSHSF